MNEVQPEAAAAPALEDIEQLMRQEGRGRRRLLTVFFVGMSLVVFSWVILSVRSLIINTDWRSVIPWNLLLNGILAFFLAVPMGLLFTLGYLVSAKCFRRSRRWVVSSTLPALLSVVILGFSIRHRVDTGVVFQDILGMDLPESARQVAHTYDENFVEEFADISFVADREDLLKLLEDLRQVPDPSMGVQHFGSVPCNGDNAALTVDWTTGEVLIEYLNV